VAGALLGGSLAIALTPPAWAADRGGNGSIAFSHAGNQIAVLANGTETILTPSGGSQGQPAFSPDGTRIAYASGYHLWIMRANGTGAKAVPVTGNPYEGDPTWSPDATKLAYINGSNGQIYTVKASGGTPKQLTTTGNQINDLKWSPDGSKIAYDAFDSSGTSHHQIFTVATATAKVTRLTSGSCDSAEPDWSPDGTQIAFETPCFDGNGNIGVMPASGGAASAVALYVVADAGYPSWSPDGSEIVFSANEGQGSEQLWESSPANPGDGTHVTATRLTSDPGQPYNTWPSWQPVHHPKAAVSPTSAAAGASVTVTVSDFLSMQTVKLSFIDANGTTTALGSAKTAMSGGFSINVTVPAAAAAGTGTVKATGVGGLSATVKLTVT
jgi:Tol biopolymer transport system component